MRGAPGIVPRANTPGALARLAAARYADADRFGQREASPSPVYGAALLMRLGFTALPGFKSPSLRRSRPPSLMLCGRGPDAPQGQRLQFGLLPEKGLPGLTILGPVRSGRRDGQRIRNHDPSNTEPVRESGEAQSAQRPRSGGLARASLPARGQFSGRRYRGRSVGTHRSASRELPCPGRARHAPKEREAARS
jgi:hypothetical protein